jgi:hypothetical protein
MGKVLRTGSALVLAGVAAGFLAAQGQKASPVVEQTTFSEHEPIRHAVPLSADVLKVLLKTKEAKMGLESPYRSKQSDPAQLFRAAEVHLSGPDEVDLVVSGKFPMSGADNEWFWVVRSAVKNPKVVLWAGGNSLELTDSRMHGYRDIHSWWSSPNETSEQIYHFDGNKYNLWKENWTPNRPGEPHN